MEKLFVALNSEGLNSGTIDFACYLANLTNSELTALICQERRFPPIPVLKSYLGSTYVETIIEPHLPDFDIRQQQLNATGEQVAQACAGRGVSAHFLPCHSDSEIIAATRFADVLILDPGLSFNLVSGKGASPLMKYLLKASESPVIIAPQRFDGIEQLLFAYDGSASSVFAIKQFSYLFPELCETNVSLLSIKRNKDEQIPNKDEIIELLKMHYNMIGYRTFQGEADLGLLKFLIDKQKLMVIMGAYAKRNFFQELSGHTADLLLNTLNLPIFIAHR